MSRGLGKLQRQIKQILTESGAAGTNKDLYDIIAWAVGIRTDADPEHPLPEHLRRSIRRALKGLVERGEVLHIHEDPQDPQCDWKLSLDPKGRKIPGKYITVEALTKTYPEVERVWSAVQRHINQRKPKGA